MNRNRLILSVTGGVIGLLALVMAYFVWSAMSNKAALLEMDPEAEEANPGLNDLLTEVGNFTRAKIYPCQASVKAIAENVSRVDEWQAEAFRAISRGDRSYEATTPANFKSFMVSDAKRLSSLPGAASGALTEANFGYGPFREYVVEGKMPTEETMGMLQRRWDDVSTVVEILATSGIAQLTDVQFKDDLVQEEPQDKKNARNKKKRNVKKSKKEPEGPAVYNYVFSFTTRPAGLIKAINALSTCERFIVIRDFGFQRANDTLQVALGGTDPKQEAQNQARGGRRGRRGAAADAAKTPVNDQLKNGIVTDPMLDEPVAVQMTVSVYDFRSVDGAVADEEVK